MRFSTIVTTLVLGVARFTIAASIAGRASSVEGFDISNYQPNVNFSAAYKGGARFVIIKVKPQPFLYSIPHPIFPSLRHQLTSTTNRPQKAPVSLTPISQAITLVPPMRSSFAADTISHAPT